MDINEKESVYKLSLQQLENILAGEGNEVTIMSTINCVLKTNFSYYFWVGFYLVSEKNLWLKVGPYQGTLGCINIAFGRGVCGSSAEIRKTIIVGDVNSFPGHIACDSASKSEIVVPFFDKNNNLLGVFDVDSEEKESFCSIDQYYLEKIMSQFFCK